MEAKIADREFCNIDISSLKYIFLECPPYYYALQSSFWSKKELLTSQSYQGHNNNYKLKHYKGKEILEREAIHFEENLSVFYLKFATNILEHIVRDDWSNDWLRRPFRASLHRDVFWLLFRIKLFIDETDSFELKGYVSTHELSVSLALIIPHKY